MPSFLVKIPKGLPPPSELSPCVLESLPPPPATTAAPVRALSHHHQPLPPLPHAHARALAQPSPPHCSALLAPACLKAATSQPCPGFPAVRIDRALTQPSLTHTSLCHSRCHFSPVLVISTAVPLPWSPWSVEPWFNSVLWPHCCSSPVHTALPRLCVLF